MRSTYDSGFQLFNTRLIINQEAQSSLEEQIVAGGTQLLCGGYDGRKCERIGRGSRWRWARGKKSGIGGRRTVEEFSGSRDNGEGPSFYLAGIRGVVQGWSHTLSMDSAEDEE